MKLQSLQIKNFKGFKDSGPIEFGPQFNVIVGQNNSGKTALIEGLKLSRAGNQPYRQKGKSEEFEVTPEATMLVRQSIRKADLVNATLKLGMMYIPQETPVDLYIDRLNAFDSGSFYLEENGSGVVVPRENPVRNWPELSTMCHRITYSRQDERFVRAELVSTNPAQPGELFKSIESNSIFLLNSQRFNIGRSGSAASHELSPDAQNLPSALNAFQGTRPKAFKKLVQNLKEIFSSIGDITVTPVPGQNDVEIMVWPDDDSDNVREATSLDKCGTGISQALAILFVAAQADEKVIVVDEISSFLHPMAIKNLIRILRQQYSHHQYIISTHYTDVIAWAEPDKIILTQKADNECTARNISLDDVEDFELLTGELGISMADVFGSDRIIWVEGETEEQCFPVLFSQIGQPLPKGTNIAKIIATGNLSLKNRNVNTIFEIYDKVSRMASPLTRACVFTMDRETMSDNDIANLKKKAKDNLLILNRRCYENYLIAPAAISELLMGLGETVTVSDVEKWIVENGKDEKYGASRQWVSYPANEDWLIKVDGAKLLEDLFEALTNNRHTYRKTTHSPQLTAILLAHNVNVLSELLDFAKQIVARVAQ